RALGMTYADVDRVARLVPAMPASFGVMTIDKALQEGAELCEAYEDAKVRELIDTARAVEGVARHASTHAAGVVIAPEPLASLLPRNHAPPRRGHPPGAAGKLPAAPAALLRRRDRAADDPVRDERRGGAGAAQD